MSEFFGHPFLLHRNWNIKYDILYIEPHGRMDRKANGSKNFPVKLFWKACVPEKGH